MRFVRTTIVLMISVATLLLASPSPAAAHTLTRGQCASMAHREMVATPPHTVAQRGKVFRACLATAARHEVRHALNRCSVIRSGLRKQWHIVRNACRVKVSWPDWRSWRTAVTVAWCEGSLHPDAKNGQYRGTFQMGTGERRRWGHGSTVMRQAKAAFRYFDYARRIGWGGGWGPWACRPGSFDNRRAWKRAPSALVAYVYG